MHHPDWIPCVCGWFQMCKPGCESQRYIVMSWSRICCMVVSQQFKSSQEHRDSQSGHRVTRFCVVIWKFPLSAYTSSILYVQICLPITLKSTCVSLIIRIMSILSKSFMSPTYWISGLNLLSQTVGIDAYILKYLSSPSSLAQVK